MARECTEETFLKDVSEHQLEILRDDHVYRHLRLRKPGTSVMSFDIITYPAYLCYSGDMGCFVFSRIHDMLPFFRGKDLEGPLGINLRYWSEKLEAIDRNGGYEEYSADKFREHIADELKDFREHIERDTDRDLADDDEAEENNEHVEAKFAALKAAVESDVLRKADDGEHAVYAAMRDFEHDDRNWFQDAWEVSFREYSYRFIWCCFALVWAIRKYDLHKAEIAKAKSDAQATG
jgi:hypothetical protein